MQALQRVRVWSRDQTRDGGTTRAMRWGGRGPSRPDALPALLAQWARPQKNVPGFPRGYGRDSMEHSPDRPDKYQIAKRLDVDLTVASLLPFF